MNTAFNVIVIILSSALFIFLVLGIVVMVMVMKLVKSLREIVAKGENLVDSMESLGDTLKRNAGAVGLVRVLMNFMGALNNNKRKGE